MLPFEFQRRHIIAAFVVGSPAALHRSDSAICIASYPFSPFRKSHLHQKSFSLFLVPSKQASNNNSPTNTTPDPSNAQGWQGSQGRQARSGLAGHKWTFNCRPPEGRCQARCPKGRQEQGSKGCQGWCCSRVVAQLDLCRLTDKQSPCSLTRTTPYPSLLVSRTRFTATHTHALWK